MQTIAQNTDARKKTKEAILVMSIPSLLATFFGLAFIYFDQYKIYTDQDLGLSSKYETTLLSGLLFLVFILLAVPAVLLGLKDIYKARKNLKN